MNSQTLNIPNYELINSRAYYNLTNYIEKTKSNFFAFWYKVPLKRSLLTFLNIITKFDVTILKTEKEHIKYLEKTQFFHKYYKETKTKDTEINSILDKIEKALFNLILDLEIQIDCFAPDIVYSEKDIIALKEQLKETQENIANGDYQTFNTVKDLEVYLEKL